MKHLVPIAILVILIILGGIASTILADWGKFYNASAPPTPTPEQPPITLTALNVTSAVDIEEAARSATANGTRPGTVILDGVDGPFVYEGADRTINVFYSNLKFIGANQAFITNADDGFFFDDVGPHHINIEGLFMICKGSGIAGLGHPGSVWIRSNTIQAGGVAVAIQEGVVVTIAGNTISAGEAGMQITLGNNVNITNNQISAPVGILLEGTHHSLIGTNQMNTSQQGISFFDGSNHNVVRDNTILGVEQAGIALLPEAKDNEVYHNRVLCMPETVCRSIDVTPGLAEENQINLNLP